MNAASAETPPRAELPPASGWNWHKIILVILLAFAAQLAFVYLLGAKKTVPPRVAGNVPVLHLADNSSELVRLTDPTLFAVPHREDFPAAAWSPPNAGRPPETSRPEPPVFLALNAGNLGAAFNEFMQTNQFANLPLNFKPEPQPALPQTAIETVLPQKSTWRLAGDLAGRRRLTTLVAPNIAVNDVIAPSRVRLLVDRDGYVVSAVLLESSGYDAADQQALALARTLRFAPADKLMFGEIIFTWHTVPAGAP